MKEDIRMIDVSYNILTRRGKTITRYPHVAKRIVTRMTDPKRATIQDKKKVLRFYFAGRNDINKKVNAFNLENIEITKIINAKVI